MLDQGVLGSGLLLKAVREAGLSPGQIVIEINESRVLDMEALKDFVETHRALGFLFALDDLGSGFSNLARIGPLKPEILKLDRSLVAGIESDFHKQEVFRALVGLGRRVGSLVLAAERQLRRDAEGHRKRRDDELSRLRMMEGMVAVMSGLPSVEFADKLEALTIGSDHSSKEYHFALGRESTGIHATEAYLSMASGKLCRTLSGAFADRSGARFTLCLDMLAA